MREEALAGEIVGGVGVRDGGRGERVTDGEATAVSVANGVDVSATWKGCLVWIGG